MTSQDQMKHRFTFVGLTLIAAYLLLEAGSYAVSTLALPPREEAPAAPEGLFPRYVPHAFLGYVYRKDAPAVDVVPFTSNAWGFPQGKDPFLPQERDAFVVVITGGSFAHELFVRGQERLREALSQIPSLCPRSCRNVRIVSLAVGGYAQPQQLMAVLYYYLLGGRIDLLLNVDGFNEISMQQQAQIPLMWHSMVRFDPSAWASIGEARLLRQWQDTGDAWKHAMRYSVTTTLLLELIHRGLDSRIGALWAEALRTSSGDESRSFPAETEQATHLRVWETSAQLLYRMIEENGGRYLEFLQPNLYLDDTKPLSTHEKEFRSQGWAAMSFPVMRDTVNSGYRELTKAALRLSQQSMRIYDLTRVFESVPAQLYIDPCCHINQAGVDLIIDAMVGTIRGE